MERTGSERLDENRLVSRVLEAASAGTAFRVLIGILAGDSITLLTGSAEIVPPIEPVPVQLFGLAGLGVVDVRGSRRDGVRYGSPAAGSVK